MDVGAESALIRDGREPSGAMLANHPAIKGIEKKRKEALQEEVL